MHAGESRRSPDQGFTVAEVLFALSILLITVIAVIGAIQFAAASTQQSTHRDAAINVGNQVIELARNMPYDELGTVSPGGVYGDPPGSILTSQSIEGFSVQTECTYGRDVATGRATYKLLKVVVSWEKPFANQVKLETAVMGRSTLTNTGDVLVEVLDSDSFEPVDGVSVVIDPASGSNRTRSTDASGQAFFGYVSIGAVTFTADKIGYLIDVSPLSGASVAADALSSYTLHAQLPSTGIVNVTGSDGQPIAGATVTLTGDTAPTPTMTLTTGAGGSVTFDNLFKGSHTVNVSASGRVPGTGVLDVTAGGQTVTLNLSLADPNQLTVTVRRSSDSAPMSGATVGVYGPSPSTSGITGSPATSAASGLATFDLPGGGTLPHHRVQIGVCGPVPMAHSRCERHLLRDVLDGRGGSGYSPGRGHSFLQRVASLGRARARHGSRRHRLLKRYRTPTPLASSFAAVWYLVGIRFPCGEAQTTPGSTAPPQWQRVPPA